MPWLIAGLLLASASMALGLRLHRRAFLAGWGIPTALALAAAVIDSLTSREPTGDFAAAGEAFGLLLFLFVALFLAPIVGVVSASVVSRRRTAQR